MPEESPPTTTQHLSKEEQTRLDSLIAHGRLVHYWNYGIAAITCAVASAQSSDAHVTLPLGDVKFSKNESLFAALITSLFLTKLTFHILRQVNQHIELDPRRVPFGWIATDEEGHLGWASIFIPYILVSLCVSAVRGWIHLLTTLGLGLYLLIFEIVLQDWWHRFSTGEDPDSDRRSPLSPAMVRYISATKGILFLAVFSSLLSLLPAIERPMRTAASIFSIIWTFMFAVALASVIWWIFKSKSYPPLSAAYKASRTPKGSNPTKST